MSARALGSRQNLQCPRQQVVLCVKCLYRAFEREWVSPFTTPQQQRKSDRLAVGVGKLLVCGIRKKQLPPVPRKLCKRRSRIFERVRHIVAQHAAKRCQQRGKALEINLAPAIREE